MFNSPVDFPDEYVNPKLKEEKEYQLQFAEAAFYYSQRFGNNLLYDDTQYDALIEIAQGRQSVDNIKNLFGHFVENNNADDDVESLSYIDIQVVNVAVKYINLVTAKLNKVQYDPRLYAVDSLSVSEQEEMETNIKAFYKLKDYFETTGMDKASMFESLDLDELPDNPDDLLLDFYLNKKNKKIIDGEKVIKLCLNINNWVQISRNMDWDSTVIGKQAFHSFLDKNGIPRIKWINPRWLIHSYVETEDFNSEMDYAGYIEFISRNEFIKEASEYLTEDEIKKVLNEFAYQNANFYNDPGLQADERYDGQEYIPIMRYYFLSEDTKTWVSKKSKYDNKILVAKGYDYEESDENRAKGEKVIKNTYTSVYGGNWVINSKVVYGHGRKEYPKQNLVDVQLPIRVFSPNYRDGRTVSLLSQIIEPLYMINVAWNKIKEILAKGWMGIRTVDFSALEEIGMGAGGKKWSPRQVYRYFEQTNTLLARKVRNEFDQSLGKAIDIDPSGLELADYFNAITVAFELIEDITGLNKYSDSSSLPERAAVGAIQAANEQAQDSLYYLFHGNRSMYECACYDMLRLTQMSLRKNNKIEGMIPSLGSRTVEHFKADKNLAFVDYGLFLQTKPSEQEWQQFYASMAIYQERGEIDPDDIAYIFEIDNLTEARHVLGLRVKKNRRENHNRQLELIKAQEDAGIRTGQINSQSKLAEIEKKTEGDLQKIVAKGQVDAKINSDTNRSKEQMNDLSNITLYQAKTREGKDSILKEGIRAITQRHRDKKAAESKKGKKTA